MKQLAWCLGAALWSACVLPFGEDDKAPDPVVPSMPPPPAFGPPTSPPPAPPPPPTESPAQLSARKVSQYSESCLNRFSERANDSRRRYLSWCDEESGPGGSERHVYGLYTIGSNPADCRQAVTRAVSMPPSNPELEQAADRYATAVEQLVPLLATANQYYERESYRDDSMAQGRQLHPQLMAAFDAHREAEVALRAQVEQIQDQARVERLTLAQNDPAQRTRYLVERTMGDVLTVTRMVGRLRVENRRLVSDETAPYFAAVEALQQGVDELQAHRPAPPDPGPISGLAQFTEEANGYLEAALATLRRVRDGETFSSMELSWLGTSAGWMVTGSPDKLMGAHNELIGAYNSMRWPGVR